MQNRPLRPFEQAAHLHVLDWCHETARQRFQAAGAVQVKAAARAVVDAGPGARGPLELPALEAAIVAELRKLYAVGHATVRSELDHQANGHPLPVGLSAAPEPPNLRTANARKGRARACGTCKMYDHGTCWGYGNWPVRPGQVCDSYAPDPRPKQLAVDDGARDPGRLRARAELVAQAVAHAIWQAVQRARLAGVTSASQLRQTGRDAGNGALGQAASSHAGGAISAGRHAAASAHRPRAEIAGARYTSVLDKKTCGACAEADDGVLRALTDPSLIHPPNPNCAGGDRCRCILVYQLTTETADQAIAASR